MKKCASLYEKRRRIRRDKRKDFRTLKCVFFGVPLLLASVLPLSHSFVISPFDRHHTKRPFYFLYKQTKNSLPQLKEEYSLRPLPYSSSPSSLSHRKEYIETIGTLIGFEVWIGSLSLSLLGRHLFIWNSREFQSLSSQLFESKKFCFWLEEKILCQLLQIGNGPRKH